MFPNGGAVRCLPRTNVLADGATSSAHSTLLYRMDERRQGVLSDADPAVVGLRDHDPQVARLDTRPRQSRHWRVRAFAGHHLCGVFASEVFERPVFLAS